MKSMNRDQFMKLLMLVAVMGLSGCGGGGPARPKTIPVTGSVMYNGKPIAGAEVSFWSTSAPRAAAGVTDADGKFSLSMFAPNDGAIPGENVITVAKMEGGSTKATVTPDQMLNDPMALTGNYQASSGENAPKPAVPEKYSKQSTSPLKENVSESNNQFVLQLTD